MATFGSNYSVPLVLGTTMIPTERGTNIPTFSLLKSPLQLFIIEAQICYFDRRLLSTRAQWLSDRISRQSPILSVHLFSSFWYALAGRQQGTRAYKVNFYRRTLLFGSEVVIASGTELLYLSTVTKRRPSIYLDAPLERFATYGNAGASHFITFLG